MFLPRPCVPALGTSFSVTAFENDRGQVCLSAVTGGSDENKGFWKYTPGGDLTMTIDNQAAMDKFKPGQEFYVDFTLAEEPVKG